MLFPPAVQRSEYRRIFPFDSPSCDTDNLKPGVQSSAFAKRERSCALGLRYCYFAQRIGMRYRFSRGKVDESLSVSTSVFRRASQTTQAHRNRTRLTHA